MIKEIIERDDGYMIKREGTTDVFFTHDDAYKIYKAVEHQYHLEDVKNALEEDECIEEEKVTDEEIEKICNEYADRLTDDDTWSVTLQSVISGFNFSYRKEEE